MSESNELSEEKRHRLLLAAFALSVIGFFVVGGMVLYAFSLNSPEKSMAYLTRYSWLPALSFLLVDPIMRKLESKPLGPLHVIVTAYAFAAFVAFLMGWI